jgi:hypothetical protein
MLSHQQEHSKIALQTPTRPRAGILQRKCACGGGASFENECEDCKKKKLQRHAAVGKAGTTAPPIVHEVLRSPGRPLDAGAQKFFETRFGHDFGSVRVHADAKAAESARAVNAHAYTVGSSLVFAAGRYAPESGTGQKLLAHELTHVMQQSAAHHPESSSLEVGPANDMAERQAESVSQRIAGTCDTSHQTSHLHQPGTARLQRQPDTGSDDSKDKYTVPPLMHWGDYGIDVKPIIPGPINAPSVEDVHQGLENLQHGDKPKNLTCPPGWRKRVDGQCCEGLSVDKCCPPWRMTKNGVCCPSGQIPDEHGNECVADTALSAPVVIPKPGPVSPAGKARLRAKLPPMTPLTVDLAIHFKQSQPGSGVAGEKALRSSLTERGQGELDTVISWLKRDPDSAVQLTGQASIEGTKTQNNQLGINRARSVAYALISSGIDVHRFSDPPGLPAQCTEIGVGLHNCGDSISAKTLDENDRQVRVRLFHVPKSSVVSATSP